MSFYASAYLKTHSAATLRLTAAKDFVIILAQGTRQHLEYIFYFTGRRFFTSNFYFALAQPCTCSHLVMVNSSSSPSNMYFCFALVLCTAKLHKNQTSCGQTPQPDINFVLLFCTGAMLQHC
jgi:hypothetical protein